MVRIISALFLVALVTHTVFRPVVVAAADPPSEAEVAIGYADGVIVPTYTLLDQRLAALGGAISELRQAPTDASLQRARQAWRAARQPWEWSESFLFGPVSSRGFDPALDTWPISQDDLEAILAGGTPLDRAAVVALGAGRQGVPRAGVHPLR